MAPQATKEPDKELDAPTTLALKFRGFPDITKHGIFPFYLPRKTQALLDQHDKLKVHHYCESERPRANVLDFSRQFYDTPEYALKRLDSIAISDKKSMMLVREGIAQHVNTLKLRRERNIKIWQSYGRTLDQCRIAVKAGNDARKADETIN